MVHFGLPAVTMRLTLLSSPGGTAFKSGWGAFHPRDLDLSLTEWRATLPAELKWDDSEPPATEINAARVRAKYYGARYMINRPFLRHAIFEMKPQSLDFLLQQPSPTTAGPSSTPDSAATTTATRNKDGVGNGPTGEATMRKQDVVLDVKAVLAAAKSCVDAAVKSTTALDGLLPERIIVTNIFGTAHASVHPYLFSRAGISVFLCHRLFLLTFCVGLLQTIRQHDRPSCYIPLLAQAPHPQRGPVQASPSNHQLPQAPRAPVPDHADQRRDPRKRVPHHRCGGLDASLCTQLVWSSVETSTSPARHGAASFYL